MKIDYKEYLMLLIFVVFFFQIPYIVGRFQYKSYKIVVYNLNECSDNDVENMEYVFNLELEDFNNPSYRELYSCGFLSMYGFLDENLTTQYEQ